MPETAPVSVCGAPRQWSGTRTPGQQRREKRKAHGDGRARSDACGRHSAVRPTGTDRPVPLATPLDLIPDSEISSQADFGFSAREKSEVWFHRGAAPTSHLRGRIEGSTAHPASPRTLVRSARQMTSRAQSEAVSARACYARGRCGRYKRALQASVRARVFILTHRVGGGGAQPTRMRFSHSLHGVELRTH